MLETIGLIIAVFQFMSLDTYIITKLFDLPNSIFFQISYSTGYMF